MTTNTVVLIIVAAAVALVLVGVVVGFGYKLRAERRLLGGTSLLHEMAEDARLAQLEDDVDDVTTNAQASQLDSEIKAFRTRGRRRESADSRQTADMRAQLKDRSSRTD